MRNILQFDSSFRVNELSSKYTMIKITGRNLLHANSGKSVEMEFGLAMNEKKL